MARDPKRGPGLYSTFEVSKLFGVSIQTVINWTNKGMLQAHRTPGGHRRITMEAVQMFASANDLPFVAVGESVSDAARILLIDDKVDFTQMVSEYLSIKGFAVEVANSGFKAGYMVQQFKPHLIVMDHVMPGLDGFGVVRFLRKQASLEGVRIVACSAFRDPTINTGDHDDYFDAFLAKPLKFDELFELLNRILTSGRD